MADKKGGGADGILWIILIIVVMFWAVNGFQNSGVQSSVSASGGVTRAVPASGNLVPQPDTQP